MNIQYTIYNNENENTGVSTLEAKGEAGDTIMQEKIPDEDPTHNADEDSTHNEDEGGKWWMRMILLSMMRRLQMNFLLWMMM